MCDTKICKGGKECLPGVSDVNLVGKTAEVFVDDTVVKSQEMEGHVDDLATVPVRLIVNGITLKMEKGIWGTDELPLLEHLVHMGKGVACDPDKVKALAALEPMQTAAEIRTFLGASGYMQRFVPEYAELVAPLRALDILKKLDGKHKAAHELVEWTEESLAAF